MNTDKYKRKLAAIFSADVVGYSRLMSEDEASTVNTLTIYREVMYSLIKQHRGRVVDSPGDNVLAEFASVVNAAQCGVAVQKEFQSRNSDLPEERRMRFRIGINLGDVIEEGDRLYGDGVNIAARLEALSDPGGICISKTAFDHIESKLPLGYEFIGEQKVKNISKPVAAYKVLMEPRVISSTAGTKTTEKLLNLNKIAIGGGITLLIIIILVAMSLFFKYPSPKTDQGKDERPSIAILPFKNMSGDQEQEPFCDGITEELINALAKIKDLRVVSRTSSFYYKGKDMDLRTVGAKLNVDHILEGSVRKSGKKLRITAQLINVEKDSHLWSETYDREMKDIFIIQDEISNAVVTNLKVKLLMPKENRSLEYYLEKYDSRFKVNVDVGEDDIITEGLLAVGINLDINGSIKGGLRAYGANINISGTNQDKVDFNGAKVTLSGYFQDDVKGSASELTISGTFEKDIEVKAHRITIAPTAVIKGNLTYSADIFDRKKGSEIAGKVTKLESESIAPWSPILPEKPSKPSSPFGKLLWTISIIIIGMLAYYIFPKQSELIVAKVTDAPIKSMVTGLVLLIALPVLIIICLITIIGIPVAIIISLLVLIMVFISPVYAGLWVGRKLLGYFNVSFSKDFLWPFLIGVIIVESLGLIPFFGFLLKILLFSIVFGATYQIIRTSLKAGREKKEKNRLEV